jgi:hypothetical protein
VAGRTQEKTGRELTPRSSIVIEQNKNRRMQMPDSENHGPVDPDCCSFCDRTEPEVGKLIAGHGAFICDACVQLCLAVVEAKAPGDDALDHLQKAWSSFFVGGQHTLAMMTGVLFQLASGDVADTPPWGRGADLTALALNQLRPRPRPPANAEIPRCGFCGKSGRETTSMHVGFGAQICGDCLESSVETRAWSDLAYREHLIRLLTALADKPWPPEFPTLV